jgi:hypothetical protein
MDFFNTVLKSLGVDKDLIELRQADSKILSFIRKIYNYNFHSLKIICENRKKLDHLMQNK